jgi:hypothetical protein
MEFFIGKYFASDPAARFREADFIMMFVVGSAQLVDKWLRTYFDAASSVLFKVLILGVYAFETIIVSDLLKQRIIISHERNPG